MNQSDTINELAKALVEAQKEFAPVTRTAENPFFKSRYADLASIVEITSPVAAKHGLAVSQFPSIVDGQPSLVTYLIHESGQWMSSEMLVLGKLDPQGQGSGLTYARRYAYSAILGIVTETDDDGNAAQPTAAPVMVHREAPQRSSTPVAARAASIAANPNLVSEKQVKLISVLFSKKKIGPDREVRHAYAALIIGHEIGSVKELTKQDASKLIDALNAEPEEGEEQF